METFLRRNFKVEGNIASIYKPDDTELTKLIAGIEVQLWHKAPMEKIFLANGFTNTDGDFSIEFEINSPVDYIVDGKISDVFLDAYYNGIKLEKRDSEELLEGLVAYWKLDEASGTTAADATGNGHEGALAGTDMPTWEPGKINNGLTFHGDLDGSGDSYFSTTTTSDFDFGSGDFTIAFWMKPTNTSGYYCAFDFGYPGAASLIMEFRTTDDSIVIATNSTFIYVRTFALVPDTWYHIVLRRIGADLELFFDSVSLGIENFSGAIYCPTSDMLFGKYSGGSETLDGTLDEIGIWKGHGLTDAEIIKLYNEGDGLQYPF